MKGKGNIEKIFLFGHYAVNHKKLIKKNKNISFYKQTLYSNLIQNGSPSRLEIKHQVPKNIILHKN